MIPAASLLLVLQMISSSTSAQLGGCPTMCGNVSVPYPFGIGANCSLPGFDLTCDDRSRLLLGDKLQVVEISLANSTVRVLDTSGAMNITLYHSGSGGTPEGNGTWVGLGSSSGTFVVSEQHNQLVLTGCNAHATLRGDNRSVIAGCSSFCSVEESSKFNDPVLISTTDGTAACSGVRCCQTPIRVGRPKYTVEFKYLDPNLKYKGKLPVTVRIAERGWFDGVAAQMLDESAGNDTRLTPVPVVLDWALEATREHTQLMPNVIGNYRSGYVCRCKAGPEGNPYIVNGCPDPCRRGSRGDISDGCDKSSTLGLSVGLGVGSGAGLLLAAIGATFFTRRIKRRRDRLLRQQFFKQNRGHLLQQLVSQNADIAERMIIPLVELDKATNNFDKAREIGGGGHGTVYKGILSDLHVVAIKKSKVAIQREIHEFINEVAILSQINHRNVVAHPPCDLHFTAVYRPCDAILCSNALRSKRMISYETPSFYTIAPGDPIHRAASQQALAGSHCYGNTRKAPVASYVPVDTML
ncbi:hypothetical protein QOZ80_1AG0006860 [Eleusine coracana subsp. coracana]|nr:hypothetical protein QOZ80_1AG0006860 [Eleusine coracana subsp. coracana]